ncbi:unnamed protein product [Owenia fusiformis]|uniref:Uncharacterized protein n=1 Tax=Owenia fusiformis TaxID=6347 RepID=A0A8J1T6Z5_OWEFU|nr:unnamed protein product [Owenia fusiformis]
MKHVLGQRAVFIIILMCTVAIVTNVNATQNERVTYEDDMKVVESCKTAESTTSMISQLLRQFGEVEKCSIDGENLNQTRLNTIRDMIRTLFPNQMSHGDQKDSHAKKNTNGE